MKYHLALAIAAIVAAGCSSDVARGASDHQADSVVIEFVMERAITQTRLAQRLREIIRMSENEAKIQLMNADGRSSAVLSMARAIMVQQSTLLKHYGHIDDKLEIGDLAGMTTEEAVEHLRDINQQMEPLLEEIMNEQSAQQGNTDGRLRRP